MRSKILPNKTSFIKEGYGPKFQDHLIEQYKIFVESSEQSSLKRMSSNKFYLAVTSVLGGIAGYLTYIDKIVLSFIFSAIGIFLCISWGRNISSYKRLNSAKFRVVHELEEYLPAKPFTKEHEHLKGYYEISDLEKYTPYLFIVLYSIILLFAVYQISVRVISLF